MSEKIENKSTNNHEAGREALEKHAHERKEELREKLERNAELSREHSNEKEVSSAEREAKEAAKTVEKERHAAEKHITPAEKRQEKLIRTKKTLDASFDREMTETRSQMPALSRAFSKVIHNKAVERTSEAVGKTVARPNAILSGSTLALIFTAVIYFWARSAGYPLSGFETIAAFIIGWLSGIIFDFVRIAITGKS